MSINRTKARKYLTMAGDSSVGVVGVRRSPYEQFEFEFMRDCANGVDGGDADGKEDRNDK